MPRLSVEINDDIHSALYQMSETQDVNITEVVRRAVSILKFVEDETVKKMNILQLVDNLTGERTNLNLP